MRYSIFHKDRSIQVSFVFKAFLINNDINFLVTEKTKESVLNWFSEYTYFAIEKYDLHNFKISYVNFHPERFNVSFEINNKKEVINEPSDNPECGTPRVTLIPSLDFFDITQIIKMLLKPDPKKEFPLILEEKLYYPIGYIPEY